MKTIYIVTGSSGQYDDYYKFNMKAFPTQSSAQAWIDAQPEINYAALDELKQRINDYYFGQNGLGLPDSNNWTDEDWEKYYTKEKIDIAQINKEVLALYPDADLDADEDFHGYSIEELEMEE